MIKIFNKIRKKWSRSMEKNINYNKMQEMLKNNNPVIVDVRTEDEFRNRHMPNAINIPLQDIESKIGKFIKDKNTLVIVYCQYGGRSAKACTKLEKMGYVNVYNLEGGIEMI